MSGKYDILWSPVDPTEYITYGSDINLYRVESNIEKSHLEPHAKDLEFRQISENTYAVHVACNSDVNLIKCVAWYPKTNYKNLLAVGQPNGHVVLTSIGNSLSNDITGKEFALKHVRQCNYVAWNPTESHLIAEGLEKHKNDPCIAIWDINHNAVPSDYGSSDRSRYSYSDPGIITKPSQELGYAETSSSFAWFSSSPKTFITGMNNRQLRLYDLRDTTRPHQITQHKSVFGVCIDPKFGDRIASFGDTHISIWDIRNFDKPIVTLQQNKPVIKIGWCPARIGMLSVLCKDSPVVSLFDIKHSVSGSDDIEPVIRERNIESKSQKQTVTSFAWHPSQENRLLTYFAPDEVCEIIVFEKTTMEWSSQLKLVLACGKKAEFCDVNVKEFTQDISFKIKDRISRGYGSYTLNIKENATTVSEDPALSGVWEWINSVRNLFESSIDPRNKISEFLGVKGLLKMTDSTEFMARTLSETQPSTWIDSDEPCIDVTVYESDERWKALDLCGWGRPNNAYRRKDYIEYNFTKGNCAKAAAIALFSRQIKHSLDLLSKYQGEDDAIFKAVAIAIAGVTDRSSLWKRTCNDLRHGLKQPYLRGMFAFLVAENNDFADVLYDKGIDVKDRVAFACIYLSDEKLHKYFEELSNNLKGIGDLRGLLLTGFTSEGVELVSRFVDVSDDIQTAALISIFCCPNSLDRNDIEKVNMWIEGYRSLLDQWKLYHVRAKFDINRTKFDPGTRNASQVHVRCNFCSKSINSTTTMQMQRSRLPAGISSHAIHKPKTCPNCRKSLPRCSVCLNNLGTASGMGHFHNRDQRNKLTKLSDWFTWCQSCRHGGHASHITTWFRDHIECPVTSCSCKCMIDCINVKPSDS